MAWLSLLCIATIGLSLPQASQAQTRHALLVGIDHYSAEAQGVDEEGDAERTGDASGADRGSARTWTDLEGAVNDVEMLRALLTQRYDFPEDNTHLLLNADATRAEIFDAIRRHLVEPAEAGDVVLFHYSGHGSQVFNPDGGENDQYDETIVPADARRGVRDIRDKELRALFHEVLAKGAELTLIFDSCHSGSVTRGLAPGKLRYIEPDMRPADALESELPPAPQEHPAALVISAAQDNEKAQEVKTADGRTHGVFSWALAEVLRTSPTDAPTRRVFERTRAILKSHGYAQEPVLAGSSARRERPLFGGTGRGSSSHTTAAVLETSDQEVLLQGGAALGLRPGTELCALPSETGAPVDTTGLCLRITSLEGLARSVAEVTKGAPGDIAAGDLFAVTRWVAGGQTALRFWMPPALDDAQAVQEAGAALNELREAMPELTWVEDPTYTAPTHVITYYEDGWHLLGPAGQDVALGTTPEVERAQAALAEHEAPAALFVQLPPTQALVHTLRETFTGGTATVALAEAPEAAHYHLAGQYDGRGVSYAWVYRPATERSDAAPMMPPRTNWMNIGRDPTFTADVLTEYTRRLNRVWGWLMLNAPPEAGSFPYTLTGFENTAGERISTSDSLRWGHSYRAVISADPQALRQARMNARMSNTAPKRYLYLFAIDRQGNGALLYPSAGAGSVENDINFLDDTPDPASFTIPESGSLFESLDASGQGQPEVDTFFLLTSAEPIPDPGIFNFTGVSSRQVPRGAQSALSRLLFGLGEGQRGFATPVPTDWSITRVSMVSSAAR